MRKRKTDREQCRESKTGRERQTEKEQDMENKRDKLRE